MQPTLVRQPLDSGHPDSLVCIPKPYFAQDTLADNIPYGSLSHAPIWIPSSKRCKHILIGESFDCCSSHVRVRVAAGQLGKHALISDAAYFPHSTGPWITASHDYRNLLLPGASCDRYHFVILSIAFGDKRTDVENERTKPYVKCFHFSFSFTD
jgi:hypothetical protein